MERAEPDRRWKRCTSLRVGSFRPWTGSRDGRSSCSATASGQPRPESARPRAGRACMGPGPVMTIAPLPRRVVVQDGAPPGPDWPMGAVIFSRESHRMGVLPADGGVAGCLHLRCDARVRRFSWQSVSLVRPRRKE